MISDGKFYYEYDGGNNMVRVRRGGPTGSLAELYWCDPSWREIGRAYGVVDQGLFAIA